MRQEQLVFVDHMFSQISSPVSLVVTLRTANLRGLVTLMPLVVHESLLLSIVSSAIITEEYVCTFDNKGLLDLQIHLKIYTYSNYI